MSNRPRKRSGGRYTPPKRHLEGSFDEGGAEAPPEMPTMEDYVGGVLDTLMHGSPDPVTRVIAARELRQRLRDLELASGAEALAEAGSISELARELGMTRAAVRKRYGVNNA